MGNTQTPQESQRDDFAQVLMMKDLKTAIKRINPWISDQQLFEVISDITSFDTDSLYKNNQAILEKLIKGTKVSKSADGNAPNENAFYIDYNTPEYNILRLFPK